MLHVLNQKLLEKSNRALIEWATAPRDKKGNITGKGNPDAASVLIFDALPGNDGLHIEVTQKSKTWKLRFKPPGKKGYTRKSFGKFPDTTLEKARKKASAMRGLTQDGEDLRVASDSSGITLADIIKLRFEQEIEPAGMPPMREADAMRRLYQLYVLEFPQSEKAPKGPFMGELPISKFGDEQYNRIIFSISKRGKLPQANKVHIKLKMLFKFAKKWGYIKNSFFADKNEVPFPEAENIATRSLTLKELRYFWNNIDAAMPRSPAPLILKLMLASGGRRPGEVCAAQRSWFDADLSLPVVGNVTMTIPKEWVKGSDRKRGAKEPVKPLKVPLSPLAVALWQEAWKLNPKSKYLFLTDEGRPYDTETLGQVLAYAFGCYGKKQRLFMEYFSPHNLRHTVGSQVLNELNELHITEKQKRLMLGHSIKKDTSDKHYDDNEYFRMNRNAHNIWCSFLLDVIEGKVELDQKTGNARDKAADGFNDAQTIKRIQALVKRKAL